MYKLDNILFRHNNTLHLCSQQVKTKNKSLTKFEPHFLKDFVQIKSPFCQRHSSLKERCECSYHKIKRSRQISLQTRTHTITAVKNSLQEYKSKISNSIKASADQQIKFSRLITKNVQRRFRKTQNLVPKTLQKIGFRKQRQSLGVHNRPFEKILRLRIQNMKDNDKVIYLMRFIKMEIRKDSRHLLNVREQIFGNIFRIVQKFGFNNIVEIDKNKLEMQQISKMMGCKDELTYEVIKQLQNEIHKFQLFLQNKFSSQNQNKQVLAYHGQNDQISFNTKVLDKIFVTEEELLDINNNSLETIQRNLDKQSDSNFKRFPSSIGFTRRLSLFNMRKKSIFDNGIGCFDNQIKGIQAWSQKESNISSISSEASEHESETKIKKIKQAKPNEMKVCDTNNSQNSSGKGTSLHKKIYSQDDSFKQQEKSKQARKFQTKESLKKKRKRKINLKSIGVNLSDFEMVKISSIIDNPNVVPLEQKVRKLFNTIKNRVEDNDSFSVDFLLKICALLSLEEAKILEQKFTVYQFDKLVLQLKRQADYCIQSLKNEKQKIVEIKYDENDDDEVRIRKISQSRKNSLKIDWFLTKTNLKNEFNNLKVSQSRSKQRQNKTRDSNLRQAAMGEINFEEKGHLPVLGQLNQSKSIIAQPDEKQNEEQKLKMSSFKLNLNDHLRILRYMKDRRPNAFMQVTQNVRNTLQMAYCSDE